MANKKVKSKKVVKNVNRKDNKKEVVNEVHEENEVRSFIKTVIIVLVSFLVVYLLFMLFGKLGMFEKGYEAPEGDSTDFTYNTALIGTVFNRPEEEYYVSFDEEDGDVYLKTILSMYSGDTHIYKVNMSLGVNADYLGVEGNPSASKSSELKIVCPTLIKIKNGRIVKYLENLDDIKEELLGN